MGRPTTGSQQVLQLPTKGRRAAREIAPRPPHDSQTEAAQSILATFLRDDDVPRRVLHQAVSLTHHRGARPPEIGATNRSECIDEQVLHVWRGNRPLMKSIPRQRFQG